MFDNINFPLWFLKGVETAFEKLSALLGFRIRVLSVVIFCSFILFTVKLNSLLHALQEQSTIEIASSIASNETTTPPGTDKAPEGKTEPNKEQPTSPPSTPENSGNTKPSASPKVDTSVPNLNTEKITPEEYKALELLSSSQGTPSAEPSSAVGQPAKEATLKAIESKIEEKIKKLEDTKNSLENLVKNVEEKDKTNIERLVKMTESMKPEEASKILETLELPILLELMETIKPAKGAAILAVMDAPKAGYLINELAKRKKVIKTQKAEAASSSPQ